MILSAASPARPSLEELEGLLRIELTRSGERDIRSFALAATPLAYCQGEFDCWVATPGTCRAKDAEQAIVRAIHDADRLVLLDEVTFGGHSFIVKRAQDRLLCLLTPFFEKRAALTHHGARYERTASLYALGWMPVLDTDEVETWTALADANAINMLAPCSGAVVVDDPGRDGWAAQLRALLASTAEPGADIAPRRSLRQVLVDAAEPAFETPAPPPPRTAALLVGSAKIKGTSVSESLARALMARLATEGVTTELHFATEFVHENAHTLAAAAAIARADLVALVSPLYVDALPALVVHALELIAAARATTPAPARLVALINCGFPEPEQIRTALRIVRHFADRAGYHWAGGLPLGGGGTLDPQRALDEQHGPAEHVKLALDLAAPALAHGLDVPAAALEKIMKAPMPDAVYRIAGDLGWRYQAHKNGVAQRALRARPLDHT